MSRTCSASSCMICTEFEYSSRNDPHARRNGLSSRTCIYTCTHTHVRQYRALTRGSHIQCTQHSSIITIIITITIVIMSSVSVKRTDQFIEYTGHFACSHTHTHTHTIRRRTYLPHIRTHIHSLASLDSIFFLSYLSLFSLSPSRALLIHTHTELHASTHVFMEMTSSLSLQVITV